ncbi:unnamed protein product [Sphagnum jensenii]|uniref:AP2/ERF domain-containing protein n=1 Tax=Sphagnum jensenii TaxID=128206 RepID=A0ABP1A9N1_9BRYO
MADTFVEMNHEYDNDLVNVLEAIAAASDEAASIRGTICEDRADQRQQQPVEPSAAPRPAESHDQLMRPGSLVGVQTERLPHRAERDAHKKSKRRIDGSMNRPIDLKEQATRSTGASEIAAGPPASKKPKRMVKGTTSCELTAAAAAETTRPKKRKYPNVPSTQERATSIFKGVGLHSKSKLWEAHIWLGDLDPVRKNQGQGQLYLGAYETEDEAVRVHDLVALKLRKNDKYELNFNDPGAYASEFPRLEALDTRDYIWSFRRNAVCFSRGTSRFKGVSKHSSGKKWEARIGYTTTASSAAAGGSRIIKKEDRYLGLHPTEEEAARCVDMVALHFHGWDDAITNFAPSQYTKEMVQQHLERLEKKDYKIPPDLLASWPKFHRAG